MADQHLESGVETNPILDAFHPSIDAKEYMRENEENFELQEESHLNDELYSKLFLGCSILFFLIAITILIMSPFSLSKISPTSKIFNMIISHSSQLFAGLFLTNIVGVGCIYILSIYTSLFVYSLLASILTFWGVCCWIFSYQVPWFLSIVFFIVPIFFLGLYRNIVKAIPQAIKVAQLTCLVAKKNSYYLAIIFCLCQTFTLLLSGIWFVIFSHSLLLGFHHLKDASFYSFTFTSVLVGAFLVFFYIWTCTLLGNVQKMLTAFVIIDWWRLHSCELQGNTSPTASLINNNQQRREDFLLDATDWLFWMWTSAPGQLCCSSLILSFFSFVELFICSSLSLWKYTIGFFWMPFWLSSSNSFIHHIVHWIHLKKAAASSLALINLVNQPGSSSSTLSLCSSYAQLQRILLHHQVHVVAPGLLHLLLDLVSFLVSFIIATFVIFTDNNIEINIAVFGILAYWMLGSSVNKNLFRMIRDVADCILLCHIRSADGRVLDGS
ncbi:hypothetical protein MDAP_001122 [Mitosporidium daphniae]